MARERKDRAPGDLLEVWAEKLVRSGHNALGLISQLKRGALLSDFESLIARSVHCTPAVCWSKGVQPLPSRHVALCLQDVGPSK